MRRNLVTLCGLLVIVVASASACLADELKNPSSGLCLDSFGKAGAVRMHPCHGQGGNQDWSLNPVSGEIRNPSSGLCLDSWGAAGDARMHPCHGNRGNQQWRYNADSGELRNPSTGLCLDSWGRGGPARMNSCHGSRGNQQFLVNGVSAPVAEPAQQSARGGSVRSSILGNAGPEALPQPIEDVVDPFARLPPVPGLQRPRSSLGGSVDTGFAASDLDRQLREGIVGVNPQSLPSLEGRFSWFEAIANSGGELGGALVGHIQSATLVPGRGYLTLETPTDGPNRIGVLGFYDQRARKLRTFELARPTGCSEGYPSNVDAAGDFFVIGWGGCRAQLYRLEGDAIEHLDRYDSAEIGREWNVGIAWHDAHRRLYLYLGNALWRSSGTNPREIAQNRCAIPGEISTDGARSTCWTRINLQAAAPQPNTRAGILYESTGLVYDGTSRNLALIYQGKGVGGTSLLGDFPERVTYQYLQFSGTAEVPSVRFGPLQSLPLTYPPGQFGLNEEYPLVPSFRWGGGAGIESDGTLKIIVTPRSMRHGANPTLASFAPTVWQTGVPGPRSERTVAEVIVDAGAGAGREVTDLGAQGLQAADEATRPARDAIDQEIARRIAASCPSGYTKNAVDCISRSCPSGSSLSDTGLHCLTQSRLADPFSGCPSGYPTRRGLNCHRSCGNLRTDAYGNCEVAKRPLQCPPGYSIEGIWCVRNR